MEEELVSSAIMTELPIEERRSHKSVTGQCLATIDLEAVTDIEGKDNRKVN